ncbi:MAG: sensor histidine kinase [Chloroflexi bacterium]|nr:sensor histidine kinase [Chloroflexota bacterium]
MAKKQDTRLFALIMFLMLAAFFADIMLPLGTAGGVLFMVPVAFALWFLRPGYTWAVAGVSAVLIVLDIVLKPSSQAPFTFVIINRVYAFLAVGIIAGIGWLQQRLQKQNERLAALSVLEERERLSRELHDDLSQLLGDIGARASAVSELLAQGRSEDAGREMTNLRDGIGHAYLGVRQYITGLRLNPWGDREFLKALEDFALYFARQAGLTLKLDMPENRAQLRLAPNVEVQAIRIVQEALTNTIHHASARNVGIRANLEGGFVQITVEDDGQGFDMANVDSNSHLGLQMMRERAWLVGGRLTVSSAPGKGTLVKLALPYQAKVK